MVLGVGDAYSVDIAPCTRQDEDGKDGVGGGRLCISCVVGVAVGFCLNWLVRAVAAGFFFFFCCLYICCYISSIADLAYWIMIRTRIKT